MSQLVRTLLLLGSALLSFQLSATTYVPITVGNITIVIPVNAAPVAKSDTFTVLEDTRTVINLLENDSDDGATPPTVTVVNPEQIRGVFNPDLTRLRTALNGIATDKWFITGDQQSAQRIATRDRLD